MYEKSRILNLQRVCRSLFGASPICPDNMVLKGRVVVGLVFIKKQEKMSF